MAEWSNYTQQDWNTGPDIRNRESGKLRPQQFAADGFQQFDYGNYQETPSFTQDANNATGYMSEQSYSGSMFIPEQPQQSAFTAGPSAAGGGSSGFEDEPPLLEELGIHPDHILQKTLTVLNPWRATDQAAAGDSDLAGPLCFCLAFGSFLMLSGKLHFNYIYGIGLLGCLAIYALLNLMAISGVAICTVVSVLGYCLIPIVGLSGLSILFSLTGVLGNILTGLAVLWCTASSSKLFVTALEMRDQQLLVAYPCGLLYSVFALITMF